jgi:hypothetical protein
MDKLPLVSCIMPTYNRRRFIPHAIRYFQRQEHQNKELIIIDDGTDCIEDLVLNQPGVKYIRLDHKITLGEKLNMACSKASGSIIANWDDDDWYAPHRLKYQVHELNKNNAKVCGINNLLYYDFFNNQAYQYKYPADQHKWLLGSSLCYYRSHWEMNPFKNIDVGMDGLFVWGTAPEYVTELEDTTMSVHMIHDQNISRKQTSGDWWHPFPVNDIEQIMQADLKHYRDYHMATTNKPVVGSANDATVQNNTQKEKNIYACLVHENPDCIIDMVRNLHYNDPSSIILIFNGGTDFELSATLFPFEQFGAVICPVNYPVKHGYLHPFALECMEFALDNFSFSTLTIVDSDQLSVQPGYSSFISNFLSDKSNVGLLSSRPERITAENKDVWTSIKAFEEYDLWKPLLKTFPDGEDKFVHWSFWPSTVFTYDAVKDLVKQFKKNILLKGIMQHTGIWATEEIILPTMVSLLGYDILLNPCCSTFNNYQKSYSTFDLDCAINDPHAFWIHPVAREYDNEIRNRTRLHLNNYIPAKKNTVQKAIDQSLFFPLQVISETKKIEGWLSDAESELLMAFALKACIKFPDAHVVEVGSFHGKATILLGKIAKSISNEIKVYAVDQHDGKLGALGSNLCVFEPSLESFNLNIENADLLDTVISCVCKSIDVKWDSAISLLFIDGLHDYISINDDFQHFSSFVEVYGYVAFHDYADYYPDVQAYVNQLLTSGNYRQVHQADSLIVIQKIS